MTLILSTNVTRDMDEMAIGKRRRQEEGGGRVACISSGCACRKLPDLQEAEQEPEEERGSLHMGIQTCSQQN